MMLRMRSFPHKITHLAKKFADVSGDVGGSRDFVEVRLDNREDDGHNNPRSDGKEEETNTPDKGASGI